MRQGPPGPRRARVLSIVFAAVTLGLAVAGGALAAYPQDPPNDPGYDPSEEGGPGTCANRSGDAQQQYLFSFIPQCTPNAQDPENSAGMFVDRAWREYTTGNPSTLIAYIEGGVNWHDNPEELVERVYLNDGELPVPTTPVDDGVLSTKDYADTPDHNGTGLVDPEDIIVRFSNGRDEDRNGYTDDISGWDFYNDQNDPATLDSAYDHANNQMEQAAAETNNGRGDAGICPDCRLLPLKAGAEALDRTDDLAEAWMYAADLNADVLVSVTADLGYSSFMNDAVNYVWRKGTLPIEASNDFNSTDHQGGMFHPHVLPGNGMVANAAIAGVSPPPGGAAAQNGLITSYRARSGYSSWGTHNVFTAATVDGTTSEATPTVGGVMALVIAYGKEAAAAKKIARPLSPSEAVQVVREAASDVAAPVPAPVAWPAKPGFDLQYGYGRPNVYRAMEAIAAGKIPPEAWINSPRWYALFDPIRRGRVKVSGHVRARRANRLRWVVEFAPGAEPEKREFLVAGRGKRRGKAAKRGFNGRLGTIDLSKIPRGFWSKAFRLSDRKELETNEHYTVTIRLRVFDNRGLMGEERRSIAVHHDEALRFVRRIGPGGESQPVFADLRGTGRQAIVFGDSDGRVHALNGRGKELPGFPVFTNRTKVERNHKGVRPGHEPVFTNAAVGDLVGNGKQWIVATSSTGRTYVWDARGHRRKGWPKTLDKGVRKPAVPRPKDPFSRPPIRGATAPPVLVNLTGDRGLEIVQAGWDGRLHAWRSNGRRVKGWPVRVTLPPGTEPPSGLVLVNDQKLDLPPTVAELDGDRRPELVQRTQYSFTSGSGLKVSDGSRSHVVAYNHNGRRVPDWLLSDQALVFYYGSAQEFITEGVNGPVTADVDRDGRTEIASAAGIFTPTSLYNADGTRRSTYQPAAGATFSNLQSNPDSFIQLLNGNLPEDAPVNFTTSGAFGRFAGQLSYTEPGSGGASVASALLTPGSGLPINNYARAFNAADTSVIPGFPAKIQGLDFLGAPAMADISGDGSTDLLVGGDSSALHGFNPTGGQVAGFPKFHTGWVVFGPSVGDIEGDGSVEVAVATREGYVMVWNTRGRAEANDEWWSYRHDERNTGLYGIDTRPPGVVRRARLAGGKLVFPSTGDDWYVGKPQRYVVTIVAGSQKGSKRRRLAGAEAGKRVSVPLPDGTRVVKVRAIDEAGNRGHLRVVRPVPAPGEGK